MKYNLRFGIMTDDGWRCFTTVQSKHLPQNNELIYLGDETLCKNHKEYNVDYSTVFRVVRRVTCYNHYNNTDDCTSIEITVEKTSYEM